MRMTLPSSIAVGLLILGGPAIADVPDLPNVTVTLEGSPGTLLVTPARAGPMLAQRGMVVHVVIHDALDRPIVGFPFQDIWLDDVGDGSLSLCNGGSSADLNTDHDGHTTISGNIAGGGFTEAGLVVHISGVAIFEQVLDISVNSPDANADLMVDLADLAELAVDYGGDYRFRFDLEPDGGLNLADIGTFALHMGETCP